MFILAIYKLSLINMLMSLCLSYRLVFVYWSTFLIFVVVSSSPAPRSFSIDYDDNVFLKDGKAFRYISGSIHYSRVPYQYWDDRLHKMAAAGLNAIQVYIPWNVHESERGTYDFTGQNDLIRFLHLAASHGLLVILRPGPYICGEWEYGGFPYWLKDQDENMILRSMDPGYIGAVNQWFDVLLPMIEPLLYVNGGNIIMVQVENEYGSYGSIDCGHDYMSYLRDMFRRYLGNGVVLFTTDGAGTGYLKCGAIDGVYPTVDFGPGDPIASFAPMRQWTPRGPLVNSEFYTGWLDYWNSTWVTVNTDAVISSLRAMLDLGANVNMYMFEGGTNFGFMNGADPDFKPVVTSYDYDAPISESGDTTAKYTAIRNLIKRYRDVPENIPLNTTKAAYGRVIMKKVLRISESITDLSSRPAIYTTHPITMETAKQAYGFALYRTVTKISVMQAELDISGIRDRGYVMLDGVPQGVVYRNAATSLWISCVPGQTLDILVENMGRTNYGGDINYNKKGIISNVTLNGEILSDWTYYSLNLTHASQFMEDAPTTLYYKSSRFRSKRHKLKNFADVGQTEGINSALYYQKMERFDWSNIPSLYHGMFVVKSNHTPADTFLNMCGWTKGVALINGFNIGRYWPTQGPQVTLYMPKTVIKPYPEVNMITILELEGAPCAYGNQVDYHSNREYYHSNQNRNKSGYNRSQRSYDSNQDIFRSNHNSVYRSNSVKSSLHITQTSPSCAISLTDAPILGAKCSNRRGAPPTVTQLPRTELTEISDRRKRR